MKNKIFFIVLLTIFLLTACDNIDSDNSVTNTESPVLKPEKDIAIEAEIEQEISESIESVDTLIVEDKQEIVDVTIYGGETLSIDSDRFYDDIYNTGQVRNKWDLEEQTQILNTIEGEWSIEDYVGFEVSSLYIPDLFDQMDTLDESTKDNFLQEYDARVEEAKKVIPNIQFSVKKFDGEDTNSNYIIVNDNYMSPYSIILSMDKMSENYPVFADETTISTDITVEYPVVYIKFFCTLENEDNYVPATIVMSKDNQLFLLYDGAFYSLKKN